MTKITTQQVADFATARNKGELDGASFSISDVGFHILILLSLNKFANFIWKDIRYINEASCCFSDLKISVKSYQSFRTVLRFELIDTQEWISFIGTKHDYEASFRECEISMENTERMKQRIELFINTIPSVNMSIFT